MAQLIEGDARGLHRGLIGNTTGLPPKFPTFPNRGVPLSDLNTVFQGIYGSSGRLGGNHQQHKGSPSYPVQSLPYTNLVEKSEVPTNKPFHRRSASDSLTYIEEISVLGDIPEEVDSKCQISQTPEKVGNVAKEDGDHLMGLLEEIQQLQEQQNLPISARSQAPHPNIDSSIVSRTGGARDALEAVPGHSIPGRSRGTPVKDLEYYMQDSDYFESTCVAEQIENDLDPKRAKRVIANRQSAQRSRVRKLQYIAELERIVGTLQTEVSSLSLQVIYLKHQRALLNMDSNALKQQAVFFVQEKRNKDSQNELLKRDIQRLQKLNEFQSLQKALQIQRQQQPQLRHIHRHSSLPTDFIVKTSEPEELNAGSHLTKTGFSSADGLIGLMKGFGGMSLDTALSREKPHGNMDCDGKVECLQ
ncbi:hypothetical protein L7F22_022693 [Adiantum nelumboides]|nr:hypothetical protein [Adiantum nelumboides]